MRSHGAKSFAVISGKWATKTAPTSPFDVPGVADAQSHYLNTINWKNPQTRLTATVQVLGFDPDARVLKLPEVVAQQETLKLPDTVLFDRGARGKYAQTIARIDASETVTTEVVVQNEAPVEPVAEEVAEPVEEEPRVPMSGDPIADGGVKPTAPEDWNPISVPQGPRESGGVRWEGVKGSPTDAMPTTTVEPHIR